MYVLYWITILPVLSQVDDGKPASELVFAIADKLAAVDGLTRVLPMSVSIFEDDEAAYEDDVKLRVCAADDVAGPEFAIVEDDAIIDEVLEVVNPWLWNRELNARL